MSFELQPSRRASLVVALVCMVLVYKALGFVGFYPKLRVELRAAVTSEAKQEFVRLYLDRRNLKLPTEPTAEVSIQSGSEQRILIELPGGGNYASILLEIGSPESALKISGLSLSSFGDAVSYGPGEIAGMMNRPAALEEGVAVVHGGAAAQSHLMWLSIDKFYSKAQRRWSKACRVLWALLLGVMAYFAFRQAEFVLSMVRGHRAYDVALALTFVVLISLPAINAYFPMDKRFKSTEKRALAPRPEFRFDRIVEFPKAYDSYYSDNFGFRNLLVNWNNDLHARHLGVAAVEGKVVMGRDGWLYLEGLPIEDYKCTIPFTDEELHKIASSLLQRRDYFKARGIPFYFLVAPNKSTIYPEFLPDSVRKTGDTCRFDQIIKYLTEYTDLKVIDVRKDLADAKQLERDYHKTDTHWNDYGAFIAYTRLMQEISKDVSGVNALKLDDMEFSSSVGPGGDLAGMLGLLEGMSEQRILLRPKAGFKAVEFKDVAYKNPSALPSTPIRLFENRSLNKRPRLLVLRDSFSDYLIPYLGESFGRSLYLWVYHLTPEIIEQEKPDVAVMEMVERHLFILGYDAYDGSYFKDPNADTLAGGGAGTEAGNQAAAGEGK